jgi:predicted NAD/FAD-binding protein
VLGTFDYAHPGYTFASIGTQPGLRALHGANRTHFCGSYHGYGFHEDAVRSAVEAARGLGLDL